MKNSGNYTDLSYLESISGGDEDFINEIIDLFKNQMPESIDEMKNALKNNDPVTIGEVAHKAKPSAIYIGNKNLEDKLKTLQELKNKEEIDHSTESLIKEVEELSQKVIDELSQS